jgi:hypothetical protein
VKTRRQRRVRAALTCAALATLGSVGQAPFVLPAEAAAPPQVVAAAAPATSPTAVQLQVLSVTPSTPAITATSSPLTVRLRIHNTTSAAIGRVAVTGLRGDPLTSGSQLTTALAHPPTQLSGLPIRTAHPVTADLGAGATQDVTFSASTDSEDTASSICLCVQGGVYPLYFTVDRATTTTGGGTAGSTSAADSPLATAITYLPAFDAPVQQPVAVSWVWPLIDRPHRLLDDGKNATTPDDVFTDDDLATSVASGGRLSRALAAIEQLEAKGNFPVTVLIDPELLDELTVMTSGYVVRTGTRSVTGTGQDLARAWLDRLTTLLETHSAVDVQLTPYADPDVQSLRQHKLSWSAALPTQMRRRVGLALPGRTLQSSVAWPPSGAVSASTLGTLVDQGVRTVIVSAASVTPRDGGTSGVPVGVARVVRHAKNVTAALTDATVERDVASLLAASTGSDQAGAAGTTALPKLVAQVAIRSAEQPDVQHSLVITPPRYVDADPAVAARAIRDTSATPFAKAATLAAATTARLPRKHSHLATSVRVAGLPGDVVDAAMSVRAAAPKISALLAGDTGAAPQVVANMPIALQRAESAAWTADPKLGRSFTAGLEKQTDALTNGVDIVRPSTGSYTLGSSTSPLPVAVRNTLPYVVHVRLRVTTINNAPGFTARPVATQTIAAGDQRTIKLPARIDRSGSIRLRVQLTTGDGQDIGAAVPLAVDSTALGVVGVVIMIVAGGFLLLALMLRLVRRVRARRRKRAAQPRPRHSAQPVGATPDAGR